MVLCRVMFLLRWENLTSTSFLGFRERCQYLTQMEIKNGKEAKTRQNIKDVTARSGCKVVALPACGNGLGQHHPGCVNSLKYSLQVYPPRDLPDEHGGHALGTQLLVNAQEVYFHHSLQSAREKEDDWSDTEKRGSVCSASTQGRGLTCHRCVCPQGWHWWSRPASCWRKLSLRSATVATSRVDAKPCKRKRRLRCKVASWLLLIKTATSDIINKRSAWSGGLTILESLASNRIGTCSHRPLRSSRLIMCTTLWAVNDRQWCHLWEKLDGNPTELEMQANVSTLEKIRDALTTSALLRSRVSHIKPWGKEYGSCRMFSLSASMGPWLVTTSSAKIAQLLSKTQLFSIQNTFSRPVQLTIFSVSLGWYRCSASLKNSIVFRDTTAKPQTDVRFLKPGLPMLTRQRPNCTKTDLQPKSVV